MTSGSTQKTSQAARRRQQLKEERDLTQSSEDWNLEKRERNLIFYLRIVIAVTSCLMLIFLGYIVTEETLLKSSEHRDDVFGAVSLVAPLVGMTTITIFLLFAVFRGVKEGDMTHPAISAGRQTGSDPTP